MSYTKNVYLGLLGGAEGGSRFSQIALNGSCVRMCAAEHASRDPFCFLERRHGLADIVERGTGVLRRLPVHLLVVGEWTTIS